MDIIRGDLMTTSRPSRACTEAGLGSYPRWPSHQACMAANRSDDASAESWVRDGKSCKAGSNGKRAAADCVDAAVEDVEEASKFCP